MGVHLRFWGNLNHLGGYYIINIILTCNLVNEYDHWVCHNIYCRQRQLEKEESKRGGERSWELHTAQPKAQPPYCLINLLINLHESAFRFFAYNYAALHAAWLEFSNRVYWSVLPGLLFPGDWVRLALGSSTWPCNGHQGQSKGECVSPGLGLGSPSVTSLASLSPAQPHARPAQQEAHGLQLFF